MQKQAYDDQLALAETEQELELARLQDVFNEERQKFQTELTRLQSQIIKREAKITESEERLAAITKELSSPQTFALLKVFRSVRSARTQSDVTKKLISLANGDQAVFAILKTEAENAFDIKIKLELLYILHQASPEKLPMKVILDLAKDNRNNPYVWDVLSVGYWSAADELLVIELMTQMAEEKPLPLNVALELGRLFFITKNELETVQASLRKPETQALVSQIWKAHLSNPQQYQAANAIYLSANMHSLVGMTMSIMLLEKSQGDSQERMRGQIFNHVIPRYLTYPLAKDLDLSAFKSAIRTSDWSTWYTRPMMTELRDAIEAGNVARVLEISDRLN